jgi:protein-export membrane protein SecD
MSNRNTLALALLILLALFLLWIDLPLGHPAWFSNLLLWQQPASSRSAEIREGLDLKGGTQALLEAQPAPGQQLSPQDMDKAKVIVERRVNALGVTEPTVQVVGQNRIIVELPGISNPAEAIQTLKSTGQLEFVEIGSSTNPQYPNVGQGTYVRTTNKSEVPITSTLGTRPFPYPDVVFKTIMTGADLKDASVSLDATGKPQINFELTDNGAKIFADYTASHVNDILAIVLDNTVLSAPRIDSAIPEGRGQITGSFTLEEAQSLAVQMRYGALPVPLQVVGIRTIGATLGADSVQKSLVGGLVGLAAVFIFMIIYYRLPGALASIALLIYAGINLAIFKLVPVTLTLPGIVGFLLSTAMAVDANILVFERFREELRWGRHVNAALEAGFNRAWTSIIDSHLSTIITCAILVIFGRNFGAQAVMGFALTLAIGVAVSLFTAVTVTRILMRAVFESSIGEGLREKHWLLSF